MEKAQAEGGERGVGCGMFGKGNLSQSLGQLRAADLQQHLNRLAAGGLGGQPIAPLPPISLYAISVRVLKFLSFLCEYECDEYANQIIRNISQVEPSKSKAFSNIFQAYLNVRCEYRIRYEVDYKWCTC